nr:uncharacterized protein LOC109166473 [Ipomoea batatas]
MEEWMKVLPAEKKKENFFERMQYEVSNMSNLDIIDADLMFFPMLSRHYFIPCIDVKECKIQIIDNRTLPKGLQYNAEYRDCTKTLVTTFKEYLAKERSALFWKL